MILLWAVILVIFCVLCFKLYQNYTLGICYSSAHLVGKVVIVTGANTGIGYETAKNLAERGARVIIACRDDKRGSNARDKLIKATGNAEVVFKRLDLASFASVREFSEHILKTEKRLDILINNAGVIYTGNNKTEDELQILMQVNHFGPFLLTCLLLPILKTSAPSRIVTVSSIAYKYGKVELSNLNMDNNYSEFQAYANSKLCNILMTTELSRKLQGTGITANCLHPGAVATDIVRNLPYRFITNILMKFSQCFIKNSWEGAQTSIYLAVTPDLAQTSGQYFADCRFNKLSALAMDRALASKLWEASERIVKHKCEYK